MVGEFGLSLFNAFTEQNSAPRKNKRALGF